VRIIQAARPKDAPMPNELDERSMMPEYYPNPVESILTIDAGSLSQIQIISVQGTILYSAEIFDETAQVDMSGLVGGAYILKATLKNGQVMNDLIIKK
jgi:hypothetical protein